MKTIFKSLIIVIPIVLSLVFINCNNADNPIKNDKSVIINDNINTTYFVLHLKITQHYHQGGDYVIVDDSRVIASQIIDDEPIYFNTLGNENGKEGCDFTAECTFEWYNYEYGCPNGTYCNNWHTDYKINGESFQVETIDSHCSNQPIPNHYGPCTDNETHTISLNLEKNKKYWYEMLMWTVLVEDSSQK